MKPYARSLKTGQVLFGVMVFALGISIARAHETKSVKGEAPPPAATKKEIELGRKAAEQIEKDPRLKLWTAEKDPKAKVWLEKLNTMATVLGKVSARPLIKYQVKIIDDKDINAFTLPNGHIYMSRALLETAGSDDEVAAVVAHEIGHNVKMHVIRGESKNKPLQWVGLAAMLAALGGGESGAHIAQITPYILTGVANSYSVHYEKEADATAIELLSKSSYNPSSLVSFMNRLTQEERRHPEVQLGIYQTHPLSIERSDAALKQIAGMGLTYSPRAVTGSLQAIAQVVDNRVRVVWGDAILMEFAPDGDVSITSSTRKESTATTVSANANAKTEVKTATPVALSPVLAATKKRADQTSTLLNELMRDNLRLYEISVQSDNGGAFLVARGQIIARATISDALMQKTTSLALAQIWRSNLQRLFWKEVTGSNS